MSSAPVILLDPAGRKYVFVGNDKEVRVANEYLTKVKKKSKTIREFDERDEQFRIVLETNSADNPGTYKTGILDIADIRDIGELVKHDKCGKEVPLGEMMFVHELAEQASKQLIGDEDYNRDHTLAVDAEKEYSGLERIKIGPDGYMDSAFLGGYTGNYEFRDKAGTRFKVSVDYTTDDKGLKIQRIPK